MEPEKDQALWDIARRRARFKKGLASYIIVNIFLWGLWYFTERGGYCWPAWVTFGWGIGLIFNYLKAYHYMDKDTMAQREYDRLKGKKDL